MSMTREEAIKVLNNFPIDFRNSGGFEAMEALKIAILALRPVSRERVEQVWKGEWNYSHTTETDHFAVVKCSKCEHEAFAIALYVKDGNFCPACGAPMTDEAVEMVMERMEALYENRD